MHCDLTACQQLSDLIAVIMFTVVAVEDSCNEHFMLSLDVTTSNKIHILSSYITSATADVMLFVMFIFLLRRMIE